MTKGLVCNNAEQKNAMNKRPGLHQWAALRLFLECVPPCFGRTVRVIMVNIGYEIRRPLVGHQAVREMFVSLSVGMSESLNYALRTFCSFRGLVVRLCVVVGF